MESRISNATEGLVLYLNKTYGIKHYYHIIHIRKKKSYKLKFQILIRCTIRAFFTALEPHMIRDCQMKETELKR